MQECSGRAGGFRIGYPRCCAPGASRYRRDVGEGRAPRVGTRPVDDDLAVARGGSGSDAAFPELTADAAAGRAEDQNSHRSITTDPTDIPRTRETAGTSYRPSCPGEIPGNKKSGKCIDSGNGRG